MTPNEKQITQIYIGYFDRAADRDGFNFWLAQANAGAAIVDIAYSFSLGSEYLSIYGGLSHGELVDKIYAHLFNRAPDLEGRSYWLNELANGKPTARLLIDIISGAQGNDKIILENAAIVARDWTDRSPAAFTIADAQNAIASINEVQPVTGNGLTVNITDAALLPWQNEIGAAMKAAWGQWELHFDNVSQIQIDVDYHPIPGGGQIASAAPGMEVVTASGYTQSGVAQEIITGMDPNGNMADGFINLHMTPDELASYAPITTVMAHEIGHLIAYRTQINNANAEHLTNYDGFISAEGGVLSFNGPNAVAAYGGPVPIHRIGAFNNYAHVDDGNLLMYPYVSLYDFKMPGIVDFGVIADMGITVT